MGGGGDILTRRKGKRGLMWKASGWFYDGFEKRKRSTTVKRKIGRGLGRNMEMAKVRDRKLPEDLEE
jgi:hypothetical protein